MKTKTVTICNRYSGPFLQYKDKLSTVSTVVYNVWQDRQGFYGHAPATRIERNDQSEKLPSWVIIA